MNTYKLQSEISSYLATYKAGKLKQVVHHRGENTPRQWRGFIFSVPISEKDMNQFIAQYKKIHVARYIPKTKNQNPSLYKYYVSDWFLFYQNINRIEPKYTASDGKAMKAIIKHLENVSNSPEDARALWAALLSRWHTLPTFYRNKTDLLYINAKLNEIITLLNHEQTSKQATRNNATDLRR